MFGRELERPFLRVQERRREHRATGFELDERLGDVLGIDEWSESVTMTHGDPRSSLAGNDESWMLRNLHCRRSGCRRQLRVRGNHETFLRARRALEREGCEVGTLRIGGTLRPLRFGQGSVRVDVA